MSLNEQFYFLSPVQVVKVTPQNMEEVAEWCGGTVAETESKRKPGTMEKYVWVPTPEGSRLGLAFPGMYITKRVVITTRNEIKVTWSVFAKAYFEKNYFQTPDAAVDATWARKDPKMAKPEPSNKPPATVVNLFVTGDTSSEQMKEIVKAASEFDLPRDASL